MTTLQIRKKYIDLEEYYPNERANHALNRGYSEKNPKYFIVEEDAILEINYQLRDTNEKKYFFK